MAKISLSPLIVDIRNKVADVVYSKWRGINYARARVTPANPRTQAQIRVRNSLARMVDFFQHIHMWIRNSWNILAKGKDYSGYNLFVGHNRTREQAINLIDLSIYPKLPRNLEKLTVSSPSAGVIQVGFLPSPVPTGYRLILHFRQKPTGEEKKTLHRVEVLLPGATTPQNFSEFPSGTVWQVYGVLGSEVEQLTGISLADEVIVT